MIWQRVVAVVNARVVTPDGIADAVRFTSRILSAGDAPRPGDVVIDARGESGGDIQDPVSYTHLRAHET